MPRSIDGGVRVRLAPPDTTIEFPSALHRKSSILASPFSSLRRVGTSSTNGTPASVSQAPSSTAVACTRSSDRRSASTTKVADPPPWMFANCSGVTKSFNTASVTFRTRMVNRASAGSAGSAFSHSATDDGGEPGSGGVCTEFSTTRHGTVPSAFSEAPCHWAVERAQRDQRRLDGGVERQRRRRRKSAVGERRRSHHDAAVRLRMREGAADSQIECRRAVASHRQRLGAAAANADVDQLGQWALQMQPESVRERRDTQLSAERGARVLSDAKIDTVDGNPILGQRDGSRRRQGEPGAARHQVELAQVDAASNRGRICEQPGSAGGRRQPAGQARQSAGDIAAGRACRCRRGRS